jgi:hypothetical protein
MLKTFISILLGLQISTSLLPNKTASTAARSALATTDTPKTKLPVKKISRLDSIEKVNNASVKAAGKNINKAYVNLKRGDSTINLHANIRKDHRFFGYAKPNENSERLILLSIFTNDVKDNPFGLKLGAYYELASTTDPTVKYNATIGRFIKASITNRNNTITTVYFEKKWVDID